MFLSVVLGIIDIVGNAVAPAEVKQPVLESPFLKYLELVEEAQSAA